MNWDNVVPLFWEWNNQKKEKKKISQELPDFSEWTFSPATGEDWEETSLLHSSFTITNMVWAVTSNTLSALSADYKEWLMRKFMRPESHGECFWLLQKYVTDCVNKVFNKRWIEAVWWGTTENSMMLAEIDNPDSEIHELFVTLHEWNDYATDIVIDNPLVDETYVISNHIITLHWEQNWE